LAVLLLLCSSSMSSADGVLAVQERFQEQSQWCWAGVSEAIFEYYGLIITQTQIAAYGTNGYNTWNYLYGFDSEPPYFRRGINMISFSWGIDQQILENPEVIKVSMKNQMLSQVNWIQAIRNLKAFGYSSFLEIGPSKILKDLVGKIDAEITADSTALYTELNKLARSF